ncbi:MAG: hypothetical protein WCG66_06960 [bacterium]
MKRLAALVFLFQTFSAFSAQLDLALIQFPEVKTAQELNAALDGVKLSELTNADRTVTSVPYLRGGTVLFAQSAPASAVLNSSTRLANSRADVTGTLNQKALQVEIRLSEGVEAGLRRFSSRTYSGFATLSAPQPCVLSIRTLKGKTSSVTKGKSEVKESTTCYVILAQRH